MFKKTILITLSFLLGSALFYFLTFKVSESVLIPLGMVGILIIPITYCSQAISKTNELKENTTLSSSELFRLDYIVNGRVRRLFLWLVFYVFAAVMLIIMNYLSSSDIKYIKLGILITGGCFGVSLLSVILIHKTTVEVSNFKAQLIQRDAKKKRKQDMLKELSKE